MTDLHYDMRNKLADNMHCMKDDVAMHLREDDPHLYMKDKLDDGKGHRKLRRKDNLMNPQALSPPIQPGAFLVSARIIFFIFFYSPSLRHALFASDNIFILPSIFTTLFLFSSFISVLYRSFDWYASGTQKDPMLYQTVDFEGSMITPLVTSPVPIPKTLLPTLMWNNLSVGTRYFC